MSEETATAATPLQQLTGAIALHGILVPEDDAVDTAVHLLTLAQADKTALRASDLKIAELAGAVERLKADAAHEDFTGGSLADRIKAVGDEVATLSDTNLKAAFSLFQAAFDRHSA